MKLTEACYIMGPDEFYEYTICQSKSRYEDQAVADHYATRIRRRAKKVSARGGPGAPNMHSYRCKFEFEGVHYHLTRGKP